jgi:ribonuclease Z
MPGDGNILLDCGESTLASLKRHYSASQFLDFMKNLRTIYISHLHGDHQLGVIGVIKEYVAIQSTLPTDQQRPIFLVAPWQLFNSLYDFNYVEEIGLDQYVLPIRSADLIPPHLIPSGGTPQTLDAGLFNGFLSTMNLKSFETCFVTHCPSAFGVAITHNSGWKIVYSGDCRPTGNLVEIGRNATLCIHEATVAETQPEEAVAKMHCTTGEAIMMGKRMNARYTLLTHFSQKWACIPEFVLEWEKHKDQVEKYGNVGIAFDHMTVKIGEMWKLPLMYPAFEVIYSEQREKRTWMKRKKQDGVKRELEEATKPGTKKIKRVDDSGSEKAVLEML